MLAGTLNGHTSMISYGIFQDTVLELIKEAMLNKLSETKCFLIDGYPREMEQGTRFEKDVSLYF